MHLAMLLLTNLSSSAPFLRKQATGFRFWAGATPVHVERLSRWVQQITTSWMLCGLRQALRVKRTQMRTGRDGDDDHQDKIVHKK